ncbi:RICIN domain-containing protein [Streptomyces coeruleorubidus]|uniref:RICIN domain-containing protein n=1 Tax=Streptomyces coeruleorubidus TaxID=116188 RepID=UPI00237F7042|nr:RICIN domain-containing protein [Streptomyces coeruleorubidus]WDV56509.1 RICIN domain-containing protein [Streptomyces coeruleorubidus]
MGRQRPLPQEARSAAEFVACMRRLKEQNSLTYRQLEANAERRGDVLARSTVADALRRDSLPRAEVVAAFVRACGSGEDVDTWLEARDRLAAAEPSHAEDGSAHGDDRAMRGDGGASHADEGPSTADEEPTPDRTPEHSARSTAVNPVMATTVNPAVAHAPFAGRVRNRRALAATAGAALLLAAVGAWALLPGEDGGRDAAARAAGAAPRLASTSTTDVDGPAPGRSRIRPALAPELCVTEGHDRKGRYRSQVAVQRPCADATPPDLSLVSVGNTGSYYIQWRHPVHGDGCLTALGSGHVVEGLLEPWPWESCSADRTSQHFFFEPVDGSNGSEGNDYRIHVVHNGMCLGVHGTDDRSAGAEIAQQRCTGARDQEFLVDAVD